MDLLKFIYEQAILYWPTIGGYALLAFVCIYGSVKITKFWMKTNKLHDSVPKIENTLTKIHTGFVTLNQVLLEKTVISQSCYSSENSPRVLNDLGKKLLIESKADEVITKLSPAWIKTLEDKEVKSLLELERESFRLILNKMNEPDFINVQNFVYEHPHFENNALTYSDLLFAMSLKLRDMYREKHPELKSDDE